MWMVLAGLIVPFQALIVPLFTEMKSFGLADTYWGIILPQLASPIAVLVFKRAFDALPRELEESALVDGASMWRIYWLIWMPLSRATIAAVGIFTFVISWNNFLWPFVVTSAGSLFTIPVGLATVQTSYGALYAQQMALAVLGALPLLIAFLLFQRQIVQGIAEHRPEGLEPQRGSSSHDREPNVARRRVERELGSGHRPERVVVVGRDDDESRSGGRPRTRGRRAGGPIGSCTRGPWTIGWLCADAARGSAGRASRA